MSSWRSYLGGRYSPFTSPQARTPPTVTENDYHYLGPDDIVDPPRPQPTYNSGGTYFPHNSIAARHAGSRAEASDPSSPDILVLKHRGTTYPLHFRAFSIGEGILRVGEVRKFAAEQIGCKVGQIKLLYKGKVLKDDAAACREEGLKQNSELMCVVSAADPRDEESSDSASESEMIRADRINSNGSTWIEVDGSSKKVRKGHRGGIKKKCRDDGSANATPRSDSPLPTTQSPSSQFPRQPSPAPPQLAHKSSQPNTTMGKLEELSSMFYTKFVPQCVQFTAHPPSDAKTRDFEYKKLSESILAQIILKLDEVETEGNEEARARRRGLVKETQAMLNSLDAVVNQ